MKTSSSTKMQTYDAPAIEIIAVEVENGIAQSQGFPGGDVEPMSLYE